MHTRVRGIVLVLNVISVGQKREKVLMKNVSFACCVANVDAWRKMIYTCERDGRALVEDVGERRSIYTVVELSRGAVANHLQSDRSRESMGGRSSLLAWHEPSVETPQFCWIQYNSVFGLRGWVFWTIFRLDCWYSTAHSAKYATVLVLGSCFFSEAGRGALLCLLLRRVEPL